MQENVIVTGGAGMIGSNLCSNLLKNGRSVFCIDNIFSGREQNIKGLLDNPKFNFVPHDITHSLDGLNIECNEIYHLACPASPKYYQYNPVETVKTNVTGTINVLEMARLNNATVLFTSTSEVYGNPEVHPQPETYYGNVNPNGPRACYDEGKRCAETLCFDYHREYGVKIKIARIFNTYGPNMRKSDGRVVSNFINQALANKDITIYGDGQQTRSFCYVDDMVSALIKLMKSKDHLLGPINLGNPDERTILELAELVINLTNSNSKIDNQELPKDDPTIRCPDVSLAEKELLWNPSTSLEEGLANTIEYFKNYD